MLQRTLIQFLFAIVCCGCGRMPMAAVPTPSAAPTQQASATLPSPTLTVAPTETVELIVAVPVPATPEPTASIVSIVVAEAVAVPPTAAPIRSVATAVPVATAAAAVPIERRYRATDPEDHFVAVRAAPTRDSAEVRRLNPGDEIVCSGIVRGQTLSYLGRSSNEWAVCPGVGGYVFVLLLEPVW